MWQRSRAESPSLPLFRWHHLCGKRNEGRDGDSALLLCHYRNKRNPNSKLSNSQTVVVKVGTAGNDGRRRGRAGNDRERQEIANSCLLFPAVPCRSPSFPALPCRSLIIREDTFFVQTILAWFHFAHRCVIPLPRPCATGKIRPRPGVRPPARSMRVLV